MQPVAHLHSGWNLFLHTKDQAYFGCLSLTGPLGSHRWHGKSISLNKDYAGARYRNLEGVGQVQ